MLMVSLNNPFFHLIRDLGLLKWRFSTNQITCTINQDSNPLVKKAYKVLTIASSVYIFKFCVAKAVYQLSVKKLGHRCKASTFKAPCFSYVFECKFQYNIDDFIHLSASLPFPSLPFQCTTTLKLWAFKSSFPFFTILLFKLVSQIPSKIMPCNSLYWLTHTFTFSAYPHFSASNHVARLLNELVFFCLGPCIFLSKSPAFPVYSPKGLLLIFSRHLLVPLFLYHTICSKR